MLLKVASSRRWRWPTTALLVTAGTSCKRVAWTFLLVTVAQAWTTSSRSCRLLRQSVWTCWRAVWLGRTPASGSWMRWRWSTA